MSDSFDCRSGVTAKASDRKSLAEAMTVQLWGTTAHAACMSVRA